MKTRKFIDSVVLHARAGNGGNGATSFRREKYVPYGGPDGGDGGHGGSITLRADNDTDSLIDIYFSPHRKAEHGGGGEGQQKHGKDGKSLLIKIPCGTEIRNRDSGEMVGEVIKPGDEIVIVKGGKGGIGNVHFKSATHQAPMEHTDGIKGEEGAFLLELKIVADAGLVGYPNAGKSSILTAISHAHPKIAAYPFTTLNPIVGTIVYEDLFKLRVADIPGLIEDAHKGAGLGYEFLRHIERAPVLVYVIDMAGQDGRKPHEDFASLQKELKAYREDLLDRPSVVVANKMDMPEAEENLKIFRRKTKKRPLLTSAIINEGTEELKTVIRKLAGDHSTTNPDRKG